MFKYMLKKVVLMLPVLLGMTVIVFLILHLSPGDPVDLIVGPNVSPEIYQAVRAKYGLDQPLVVQYFKFLGQIVQGDLGTSILQARPVAEIIWDHLFVTLEIGFWSLILSLLIAVPAGVIAAVNRNKFPDYMAMTGALLGMCMPPFWLGLLLLYFFAFHLQWFPISGYGTWQHLVLPVFAIGITDAALTARMVRSSMLEVIRQDYIRTARSKGLAERVVIYQHALKNALIPIITILGLKVGWILGGSVVIEIVFSIPGLGRMMIDSIISRDYPVVQGAMLMLTTTVILASILADVLYAVVDPRIKY